MRVYSALIQFWMRADVVKYVEVFPVLAESPTEHKRLEQRLQSNVKRLLLTSNLSRATKIFTVTIALQSLTGIRDYYKVMYAFFAPRDQGEWRIVKKFSVFECSFAGLISYDRFEMLHDGEGPPFGTLVDAYTCLLQSSIFGHGSAFTKRVIFMLLEDMTSKRAHLRLLPRSTSLVV